jgi:arginyl-tRNA synthetase
MAHRRRASTGSDYSFQWKRSSDSCDKIKQRARACQSAEAGELSPATDPRFGDYQTNAALVLGKQRRENPRAVRRRSSRTLMLATFAKLDRRGAGFINFALEPMRRQESN